MPKLARADSGNWKARKRIPKDVGEQYRELYGQAVEVKLTVSGSADRSTALRYYHEWLHEHEQRVGAIRAAMRGEGMDLTEKEAHALAGDWYRWFVARHEEVLGSPEKWEGALWAVFDQLEMQLPEDLARQAHERTKHDLGKWTRNAEVRQAMRPTRAEIRKAKQESN